MKLTNRYFLLFFFSLLYSVASYSQVKLPTKKLDDKPGSQSFRIRDSIIRARANSIKVNLNGQTKYTDYKIISYYKDTTYIDTTLTIQKEYKFNFLRKDLFEYLEFHNIGQALNPLAYSFDNTSLYPDMGFRTKQSFYKSAEEINYYQVPTPTSEIMFRSTLEQGQFLESFFTLNFNKRLNASIAYTGLRSLGKYRRSLISQGFFRTTISYTTPKEQYSFRTHFATHDLFAEENGGLTPESLIEFIENDPDFQDRARLDVNLADTENQFKGSRFFFEHDYKLLSSKDSTKTSNFSDLKIGHQLNIERKFNDFLQEGIDTAFFGNSTAIGKIRDKTEQSYLKNQLFLEFNSKYVLGRFKVKSDLISYKYGYKELINLNSNITTLKLEGNAASFGAEWRAKVNNIYLDADGSIVPGNGRLSGTNLNGKLAYVKDSLFTVKANVLLNSKSPNFNFLLHQSVYDDYNWQNDFENIRIQDVGVQFLSKWGNASVNFTNIENFTYFGEDHQPYQSSENITYLKAKISKEFKVGKFALNNTVMYQNVSSGMDVFRVPELVTRNTLYYSDYWFKNKPLYLQVGVTLKYFSKYYANNYDPLLSEFILQNQEEIGGYPTVDFFFNSQVRRTRIYFKIDNVFSPLLEKNYFTAPNYPYRDFVIRFGLVWNWFI